MIAATTSSDHLGRSNGRWQLALREAITDPAELLRELELDPALLEPARQAARLFGLKVPRGFAARMRKGDIADPLLLQVLPLHAELDSPVGYVSDPVGDLASSKGNGVLHKYQGRALLIATGACAVHCRYCFRREFPYSDNLAAHSGWEPALDTLAGDPTLREVILSGGDPLSLSDHKLRSLTDGLRQIPHIERLRIHTRFPIVLPERVDAGFTEWLKSVPWRTVVVIHANHPNELDAEVGQALAALANCGATLLNQSVLLRGVNNDAQVLAQLSDRLFEAGVLPYYLNLLDPVRGAAHFDIAPDEATHLLRALAARLPGYLVPRLVKEIPGAPFKTPVLW